MSCFPFIKDPDAKLDYKMDWSDWLTSPDTLSDSEWIVPSGMTSESETFDSDSAIIILSGGTVGQVYEVVNRITTGAGLIEDRTILFTIRER